MNMQFKAAAGAAAILVALAAGNACAESSYGYDTNAANPVSAQATIKINVTTPKLIVLRVGARAAQTVIDFTNSPTVVSAPGNTPVVGVNQVANWNGAAPAFSVNNVGAIGAYVWHNSTGAATLTCSAAGFSGAGLTSADVLVASVTGAATDLAHPGADTGCTGSTPLTRNVAYVGSWTYSMNATSLANAVPGVESEVVTYTAAAL